MTEWVCLNPSCPVKHDIAVMEPDPKCPRCDRPLLPKRETPITDEEREKWGFSV